jgi:PKD-like domain/CHU_C Type IX secretion signal domain
MPVWYEFIQHFRVGFMDFHSNLMRYLLITLGLLISCRTYSQMQLCPLNSDFSSGTLTHWEAYTGNNKNGNGASAIMKIYDSTVAYPSGTLGAISILEYELSENGIQVNNTNSTDKYGGFATIPSINGYKYGNSILLGSTNIAISSPFTGPQGGFIRGIRYMLDVPSGPSTQPYTMTYAYAMVLENGSHNSNEQPLFSASVSVNGELITCASPQYYLPTENNANALGGNAVLDTAAAIAEGFSLSSTLSPNADPNSTLPDPPHLQDVWTKGWQEVTFDLSPYRGKQVVLTFEADNCVPGGHFAYAYVALRDVCNGLVISGATIACAGGNFVYSVPGLTGATYKWTIPGGWSILSGAATSTITVRSGDSGGVMAIEEVNSCADLKDTISVAAILPTISGSVGSDTEVCTGQNTTLLSISGTRGTVLNWISSIDNGNSWDTLADVTPQYTAQNLTTTTIFRALVQNGTSCSIDTSSAAVIIVDPKSVSGQLNPNNIEACQGQIPEATLILKGQTGTVINWELTTDTVHWSGFSPVDTSTIYNVVNIGQSTQYRLVVQSGVCPADTSSISSVTLLNAQAPQAVADPADTTICYGDTVSLKAIILSGTNYTWTNTASLANEASGTIDKLPYDIDVTASPLKTTTYELSIENAGCPYLLVDTFQVNVYPQIVVKTDDDTTVASGEPLQLQASASDTGDSFTWTPATYLNNAYVSDPISILTGGIDSINYVVKATSAIGCYGVAHVNVRLFKTGADIFVPNAFTPGSATNNIFRPAAVGIASLQYFRVYNRWGQMVYTTTSIGQGWDGYVNGKLQETGSYVWIAKATAYTGKIISKEGVVVLIR